MKFAKCHIYVVLGVLLLVTGWVNAKPVLEEVSVSSDSSKLFVLWTSGDREVALKMVFMYTYNAKKYGWWKDITLVVWGPSAKLLSGDKE